MQQPTQTQIINNNKQHIKSLLGSLYDFTCLVKEQISKKEIEAILDSSELNNLLSQNLNNLEQSIIMIDEK